MATNNQINLTRSGVTGTGSFAGTTSPTFVTPTVGVATADSINFGASSTDGIKGVTSGSNAAAGYVGQYKSTSVLVGSAVSLTTATPGDVITLSLEAGDWDVSATVIYLQGGSGSSTFQQMSISTTSVTHATKGTGNNTCLRYDNVGATQGTILNTGINRLSLSGTTTVYVVVTANFSGTGSAYGFIGARRAR